MDVLRTIVSALSFYDPEEKVNDHEANVRKAIRLTAQMAYVVAAYDRIRKGKPLVEPDRSLSHAGNFLYMLNGELPSATAERALDIALILHADHELNASTFAARVVAATLSDMHSAITAAIGALKGPLHGGANEAVFHILEAIDASGADPVEYIKGMLAQKKKIPGFGHRVYHTEDPRATHLRKMSEELGKSSGNAKWFEISHKIEEFIVADRKLNANVDFYSASTYHDARHRYRPVHAGVRGVARLGLDGARHRAVERQSADPAARGLPGPGVSQPLRGDGKAVTVHERTWLSATGDAVRVVPTALAHRWESRPQP